MVLRSKNKKQYFKNLKLAIYHLGDFEPYKCLNKIFDAYFKCSRYVYNAT